MSMKIGIPKEIQDGERRVAATPDTAQRLQKLGFSVAIESGAGSTASFTDEAYEAAGVEIIDDTRALWSQSDIILKVRAPQPHPALNVHEIELMHEGQTLISFIWPAQNEDLLKQLSAQKVNVLAMDSVPAAIGQWSRPLTSSGGFSPAKLPPPVKCRPPK